MKVKFLGLHHTCSPVSPACSQRWWDPYLVPQITDQVSGPRGLTRRSSLQQSFPLAESLRASWFLVCKTCEEKHWVWDSTKEHPAVLSLESAHFVPSCPWRCWPLPSLTNVQTTVQRHCPEQVVWTLGRRSRISRSFHCWMKNPVPGLGRACLPAPGLIRLPPWILSAALTETHSRAVISSLDVAHLQQTRELAMNLGPGKGGGLGWRVHIWDDVTLGRFGYALCRWRDR